MTQPKLGRPPVKSKAVARALRRNIASGSWRPGERVPTRRELCETLDCSAATLQQAMNTLTAEGFVVSMARSGTVVNPASPHLTDIAVVFPQNPAESRFWAALSNVASKPREDGLKLRCWYGIDDHINNPDRLQLEQDVRNNRLAGIFFAFPPYVLRDSPMITRPGIPRVAFGSRDLGKGIPQELSVVTLDSESFLNRAFSFLRESGCQRPAVISPPRAGGEKAWTATAKRYGYDLPPWAYQEVDQAHALSGRFLARLLFCKNMSDCPDGLIIADDNLVEQVTLGIADAGVSVSADLAIVAHCNFPWPPSSALPVTRLGFDAQRVLEEGLRLLRTANAGNPSSVANVEAMFEGENQESVIRNR